MPVYLPVNARPMGVGVDEPTILAWPDGMMVLEYVLVSGHPQSQRHVGPKGEVSARHIFTGNIPSLQLEATELFDSIQIGCELVRETKDSPYFSRTVVPPEAQWPECLNRARVVIANRLKTYICQGDEEIRIQRLLVKGWVDNGSRRV